MTPVSYSSTAAAAAPLSSSPEPSRSFEVVWGGSPTSHGVRSLGLALQDTRMKMLASADPKHAIHVAQRVVENT
eukprot:7483877-Pyramimonas_sp.AAC.1